MPKYKVNLADKIFSYSFILLMLLGCVTAMWFYTTAVAVSVVFMISICTWAIIKGGQAWKQKADTIKETRKGESICSFTKAFDFRQIDTWIIRAVYEELQEYVGKDYPIRPEDKLIDDLEIDEEDLALDIARVISQRTGRSLDNYEKNPYCHKVTTVRDLVMYFSHQAKSIT